MSDFDEDPFEEDEFTDLLEEVTSPAAATVAAVFGRFDDHLGAVGAAGGDEVTSLLTFGGGLDAESLGGDPGGKLLLCGLVLASAVEISERCCGKVGRLSFCRKVGCVFGSHNEPGGKVEVVPTMCTHASSQVFYKLPCGGLSVFGGRRLGEVAD